MVESFDMERYRSIEQWDVNHFISRFMELAENKQKTVDTLRKRVQELEYRNAYLEKQAMLGGYVGWMNEQA